MTEKRQTLTDYLRKLSLRKAVPESGDAPEAAAQPTIEQVIPTYYNPELDEDGYKTLIAIEQEDEVVAPETNIAEKSLSGHASLESYLEKAGGPFIGPRGGKWADSKMTIPWKPEAPKHAESKPLTVAQAGTNAPVGNASDPGPKLAKQMEDSVKKLFPQSVVDSRYMTSLGGHAIRLTFALGPKEHQSGKIMDNDPAYQVMMIHLPRAHKEGDPLPEKMSIEMARGGSLLVNAAPGKNLVYESVKLGFRKKTGSADQIAKHVAKYFENVKKVVKENYDNLPKSFKKEGLGLEKSMFTIPESLFKGTMSAARDFVGKPKKDSEQLKEEKKQRDEAETASEPDVEKGELSQEKARQILHDKTVHGHPITDKQRRYFGAVASGSARKSMSESKQFVLAKAKYIKRTGTPGNYRYEYDKPKMGGNGKIAVEWDSERGIAHIGGQLRTFYNGEDGWSITTDDGSGRTVKEMRGLKDNLEGRQKAILEARKILESAKSGESKEKKAEKSMKETYDELRKAYGYGAMRVTEWADQFMGTPMYLEALNVLKSCAAIRKEREAWDRTRKSWEAQQQMTGAAREKYRDDRARKNEVFAKQYEAEEAKKAALEAKLVDYRIEEAKKMGKSLDALRPGVISLDSGYLRGHIPALENLDDFLEKALPKAGVEGGNKTPPQEYREGGAKSGKDYADPKNFKYPIDTEEHVRAALSYFSKPKNAGVYSASEQKSIWKRIHSAAKKFKIEVSDASGPPSVEKSQGAVAMILENWLEKSGGLPEGEPKFGAGPEQGGPLADVGRTSGSGDSSSGTDVGAPTPGHEKLSEDDAEVEGQMKEHKKPIERLARSVSVQGAITPAGQLEEVAYERARLQKALEAREEANDVRVGGEPHPYMQKSLESDSRAAALLEKSTEAFYADGIEPRLTHPDTLMRKSVLCKGGHKFPAFLTACPECGDGTVAHRPLPSDGSMSHRPGGVIQKSTNGDGSLLKSHPEEGDVVVGGPVPSAIEHIR